VIEPGEGEVLASYASTPWAGRPAVLAHQVGAGRVYYLGTRLGHSALRALLGQALGADLAPATGVERVIRRGASASYEFWINHSGEPVRAALARGGRDLLADTDVAGHLDLPPQGVAILRREA
jgi:beta-galactosidase